MDKATYISKVKKLHKINNTICQVNDLLDTDLLSGKIGELFDFAYDTMIPEGADDDTYERFEEMFFSDPCPTDEEIGEFFDSLFN